MARRKFVFNMDSLKVDVHRISIWRALWIAVKYIFISFAVATAYYLIIIIFFDTKEERRLKDENEVLSSEMKRMEERLALLEDVTYSLKEKDAALYNDIFSSLPPEYVLEQNDTLGVELTELHRMSEKDLIWTAYVTASRMDGKAHSVSSQLESITAALDGSSQADVIPSIIPLRNFSINQTGASVGRKFSPFFKTIMMHEGIDLMAPEGADVIATATGTVISVEKQERGFGNRVTIEHLNGLSTVYAHLADIKVHQGQRVARGEVIGHVGMSGRAFAPHLHYEVVRDGVHLEPVHFFFSELNEKTYREMLITALTNGQSMD